MYSAEVTSNIQRTVILPININNSIRIDWTDLSKSETLTLLDSGFAPNKVENISFLLRANIWYRMDIFIYNESGSISSTQASSFQFDPLAPYIHSWRDITPEVPIWVSVTGADSNNDPDLGTSLNDAIKLLWNNSIFVGQGGFTEIWASDDDITYTIEGKTEAQTREWISAQSPGTTKWFKIRHTSASGIIGPYTAARKGIVTAASTGNTVVEVEFVDAVPTLLIPNINGWYNPAVLEARITVTTDLTIARIWFTPNGDPSNDENLGAGSPAYGPSGGGGLAESANGQVGVRIEFTNGDFTDWQWYTYQYDKTNPTAPTLEASADVENFEIEVHIQNVPTDALSGISGLEWFWSTSSDDPGAEDTAIQFQEDAGEHAHLSLGMSQYDYTEAVLYVWVRALDKAGNRSAWVQFGGGSGFVDLSVREITGQYEVTDLMELVRTYEI